MNSRMDRYNATLVKERTEKNKKLYEEVSEMNVDYIDINVNNAIEINPSSDKGNLTRAEYQRRKEIDKIIPVSRKEDIEVKNEVKKEDRIYDINEILRLARENKLFENDDKKRLINTEYNILTKLDISQIDEKKTSSKENLRELIDAVYGNEEKEKIVSDEVDDKDLLHNLLEEQPILKEETAKDILDKEEDLATIVLSEEDAQIVPLDLEKKEEQEEKENEEVDKEEQEPEKEDEEDTDTFELEEELKRGKATLIIIIIVVLILLALGGYLFFKYFI